MLFPFPAVFPCTPPSIPSFFQEGEPSLEHTLMTNYLSHSSSPSLHSHTADQYAELRADQQKCWRLKCNTHPSFSSPLRHRLTARTYGQTHCFHHQAGCFLWIDRGSKMHIIIPNIMMNTVITNTINRLRGFILSEAHVLREPLS